MPSLQYSSFPCSYSSCQQTLTAESSEPLQWGIQVPGFSTICRVPLDQQERRNHRFFFKQFTQAATYFKSPSLSSYKCFSLQPQPRLHQSPQVTSPHQAGLLSQSGIKGGPSTKHGLVYYLEQTSIWLACLQPGMASYNSPFYIFFFLNKLRG